MSIKNQAGTTIASYTTYSFDKNGCNYAWKNDDGSYVDSTDPLGGYSTLGCDGLAIGSSTSFADKTYTGADSNSKGVYVSGTYTVVGKDFVVTPIGAIEAFRISFTETFDRVMNTSGTNTDFFATNCYFSPGRQKLATQSGTLWYNPQNGMLQREFDQILYPCGNIASGSTTHGEMLLKSSSAPVQ